MVYFPNVIVYYTVYKRHMYTLSYTSGNVRHEHLKSVQTTGLIESQIKYSSLFAYIQNKTTNDAEKTKCPFEEQY